MAAGKPVYVSQRAFDRMNEWLLDDAQWQAPEQNNKEMYLKQCGLLLFAHYRRQLSLFLHRLEDGHPRLLRQH